MGLGVEKLYDGLLWILLQRSNGRIDFTTKEINLLMRTNDIDIPGLEFTVNMGDAITRKKFEASLRIIKNGKT